MLQRTRAATVLLLFGMPSCLSDSIRGRTPGRQLEPFHDDGYFDPFTYDWGISTSNASETMRLRSEYHARRLDDTPIKTCRSKECRSSCGSDETTGDDEAGPCGINPKEQCPCCVRCDDSENFNPRCGAFSNAWGAGGVSMEDKYLPELKDSGSCLNIEDRIARLELAIFGQGRTFRDSELCRKMALEYICIFWGSQNAMYDNRCVGIEQSVDPPLQPCRSMCVQLAITCANNPDYKDLCNNLPCGVDNGVISGVDCKLGNNYQQVDPAEECFVFSYEDLTADLYNGVSTTSPSLIISHVLTIALLVFTLFKPLV